MDIFSTFNSWRPVTKCILIGFFFATIITFLIVAGMTDTFDRLLDLIFETIKS